MNTNADITLYNKWYDRAMRTDRWLRTQISSVNWYGGQAVTVGDNGLLTADKYTVRIPLQSAPAGRQYLPPEEYAALEEEELAGAWTLQNGDVVVRGLINDATPPKAADKTERFVIMGMSDNRRGSLGMQHWKVVGA